MKKVSTIIMALAVIMGMTQCTKPAMQLYDGTYTGVTKEITFSTGGSSKVEIENVLNELKFKWQGTDKLYVYGSASNPFSGGNYCGSLALVKGAGTENGFFSGTLDNVPTSGTLRFYYCAEGLFDELTRTIAVDLSEQDGSLNDPNGIASHLVAYADVAVMESGDYSATLAVPYSVVKLDLHEFGTTDITMTGTTKQCVTISGNGECTFTAATPQETTISGAGANTYISVIPESGSTTLSFEGDNGIVGSRDINLESNTFQTLNNGGDPVPVLPVETDEWINFNDPSMGVTGMPLWAKYNVGVDKEKLINNPETTVPTDWYGDYYAWGEVEPYYADGHAYDNPCENWKTGKTAGYTWASYSLCNGSYNTLNKYNTSSTYGTVDNKTTLEDADDAASQNVTPANTWRMPTGGGSGEWKKLKDNTLFVWTTSYKGITNLAGYVVYKVKNIADKGVRDASNCTTTDGISNDGGYSVSERTYAVNAGANYQPHMFLPAAGYFGGTSLYDAGSLGNYWSSSLYSDFPIYAWFMYFNSGYVNPQNGNYRYDGLTVRPVQ